MALGLSNYVVTDMVRPPQGFWSSPDLTKEEYDAWIRLMPEIRIKFSTRKGTRGVDEFFIDTDNPDATEFAQTGFLDQDYAGYNDGPVLYGREAVVRRRGVETPMNNVTFQRESINQPSVDYERLSTVGRSTSGFFFDNGYLDVDFVCSEEIKPELYTLQLDGSYSHDISKLTLQTFYPSERPLSLRYEVNSDVGDGGPWFFLDADVVLDPLRFVDREDGGDRMLADRVYLLDTSVTEPMTEGMSFVDVSRIGIEPYLAEIQVDLGTHESGVSWVVEKSFLDDAFLVSDDWSHLDRACRAMVDAKALRDTILADFAPKRPLLAGDYVDDSMTYGMWVAEAL
jgi:hypothetical protein